MSHKAFLNKDHATIEEIQTKIKPLEQNIKV
jgi:hypothetical protein